MENRKTGNLYLKNTKFSVHVLKECSNPHTPYGFTTVATALVLDEIKVFENITLEYAAPEMAKYILSKKKEGRHVFELTFRNNDCESSAYTQIYIKNETFLQLVNKIITEFWYKVVYTYVNSEENSITMTFRKYNLKSISDVKLQASIRSASNPAVLNETIIAKKLSLNLEEKRITYTIVYRCECSNKGSYFVRTVSDVFTFSYKTKVYFQISTNGLKSIKTFNKCTLALNSLDEQMLNVLIKFVAKINNIQLSNCIFDENTPNVSIMEFLRNPNSYLKYDQYKNTLDIEVGGVPSKYSGVYPLMDRGDYLRKLAADNNIALTGAVKKSMFEMPRNFMMIKICSKANMDINNIHKLLGKQIEHGCYNKLMWLAKTINKECLFSLLNDNQSYIKELYQDIKELKELGSDVTFVKECKTFREIMTKICEMIEDRKEQSCFYYSKEQKSLEDSFGDWIFSLPKGQLSLSNLGKFMGHCVAKYGMLIKEKRTTIINMKKGGIPNVTLEIRADKLVQAKCRFNNLPSQQVVKVIKRYCEEHEIDASLCTDLTGVLNYDIDAPSLCYNYHKSYSNDSEFKIYINRLHHPNCCNDGWDIDDEDYLPF